MEVNLRTKWGTPVYYTRWICEQLVGKISGMQIPASCFAGSDTHGPFAVEATHRGTIVYTANTNNTVSE